MSKRSCFQPSACLGVLLLLSAGCASTSGQVLYPTPTPASALLPFAVIPASPQNLSGAWLFQIDPQGIGEGEGWAKTDFDDSAWTSVTVPHTWNVMPEHSSYSGVAWYRRKFSLPAEEQQAYLRLRFEAVFYLARVWVNGIFMGEHAGGYTPFELDVSQTAKPGENVIAVQVDNQRAADRIPANLDPLWSFDWYNYGGIVRDVSLIATSPTFIAQQQIVAIPHLTAMDQADSATISITTTVHNHSTSQVQGALAIEVLPNSSGQVTTAGKITAPITLAPGAQASVPLTLGLVAPNLWHFDHPFLYRLNTSLLTSDGKLLHADSTPFGIRSVELKDARLYLNGEPVRLVGLTRHADSPEYGLAETTTVMAADYDDLKTLNEVLSRPVHYPQAEFILDYCDRQGILLIPEVPAWQLTPQQMTSPQMRALEKQQLSEMVAQGFNHPSIWAWSIANEIASQTREGHEFVREMIAYVKSLDGTRPISYASNRLYPQPRNDAMGLADFVLMNQYLGTWAGPKTDLGPALDRVHAAWPGKAVIISEFGFEPRWNRNTLPASSLDPAQYYFVGSYVTPGSDEADAVRRQLIQDQMAVFRKMDFVAGAIFWTYQDYRTPTDFVMGVVDPQRTKRASWQVLREEYSPVLIDEVILHAQGAEIALRTRGPVETDMPAYTLRGYTLHWELRVAGGAVAAEGDIALPSLAPGARWSGKIEWSNAGAESVLRVSVLRPTGFAVIEQSHALQSKLF